jgi:MFS family permease
MRWYQGITSYQWLVLVLASAGWVFDVFEGQIYAITRVEMLTELLGQTPDDAALRFYGDVFLAVFQLGGTLGGIAFGSLADRWGRRPMLIATILTYSVFSGLTYFADSLWTVGVLRFLVAIGVGGEWAVAAALVAEEFPARTRAHASGIFHATSILGTWMAALAGRAVGAEWRYAYLVGIVPALLVVLIRFQLRAVPSPAANEAPERGSLAVLLTHPRWRTRALLGMLLATVGLATFWGVTIAGQDLTRALLLSEQVSAAEAQDKAKFAYGIVETAGGGLGLLTFGPLAAWCGRRKAFLFFQLGAVAIVPVACYVPGTYEQLLGVLVVYGFFTLGMHAGFAVYFPELFPTHLRATGAGFCFNGGRLVTSLMLVLSGWLKAELGLHLAIMLLGLLFVPGMVIVLLLPETKDQPLPE